MSYSIIVDVALREWTTKHGLHVQTQYQDVEVRSVDIVSPCGKRFQLWIDEPDENGDTEVHIWDMKKKRKDFSTENIPLKDALEAAYQQATEWF